MPSKRRKEKSGHSADGSVSAEESVATAPPLIFISHDHRDALLAEGLETLIQDSSAGFLRTFRSTARAGSTGIEYGREWYQAIMSKLRDARELVALITPNSLNRPWILYEAGVVAGRLEAPVIGVVFGLSLERAIVGPFAQFQNSANDEDAMTNMLHQLVTRNSSASPRPDAIRVHVKAFLQSLPELMTPASMTTSAQPDDLVPKMFEEIKAMFREIASRQRSVGPSRPSTGLPRFHEVYYEARRRGPEEFPEYYARLLNALELDSPDAEEITRLLAAAAPDNSRARISSTLHVIENLLDQTPPAMLAADDRDEWRHALTHLRDYVVCIATRQKPAPSTANRLIQRRRALRSPTKKS